ncbi:MAG: CpsD/CapB family tyrosine-protein kinase [Pseudomonadota bacterium]
MERLQAAIEKAREQRATVQTPSSGLLSTNASAAVAAVEDAWLALPEIKHRRRLLHHNRIVAYQSGQAAAPYDILRTRLIQQAQANKWRRIAIVSPRSSCGKTTTAANLAFGLGRQSGIRSIVMDFDLRRCGLGRILGQKGRAAMADVLEEQVPFEEVARRHGRNLIFGLSFGASQRASEILQSQQTRKVLKAIEASYTPNFMIFDLPPLSAGDDNFGFLSHVDAALIVAEAERTSLAQIDVAERQVAELTNVMGVVLNKCRYASNAYGHEEGYYY